jgi:hypothetical protein
MHKGKDIYIYRQPRICIKTALLQINHPSKHIIIKGEICFAHLHKKKKKKKGSK